MSGSQDDFVTLVEAGQMLAYSTEIEPTMQASYDVFVPSQASRCVVWVENYIYGDTALLPESRDPVGLRLEGARPGLLQEELERKCLRALELSRLTERARLEVARFHALEAQLEERNQQLIEVNRELESFAYSVSHDLRAPLRSIMSASMIVLEDYADRLDEEGKAELLRSSAAAKRMSLLIDDLLEYSRLGRREMSIQHVDISAVAGSVGVELKVPDGVLDVEPAMQAVGDPNLLRVLFTNLIENAWKYSREKREPHIAIGRQFSDGEVVYYVRDNGIGFDEKYLDKLFVPFERLHNAADYPGTGIGLPNVKRIVTRHHGRIWATATVDEGACFFFTLGPG